MLNSVLTIAPLRLSFIGGGTDISNFYSHHEGAVISCAINKYVYVHVKRHDDTFQEKYRISYSVTEHTNNRDQIENAIVKGCLEFLDLDMPLQISTSADLPTGSGLGSSSSFTSALLLALHTMKGEKVSKNKLADEACKVEIEVLNKPIGKQDQYASVFGGLNLFKFLPSGKVLVEPLKLRNNIEAELLARSELYWTKQTRQADVILADQGRKISDNRTNLIKMTKDVEIFKNILSQNSPDWSSLTNLIDSNWEIKKKFSRKIASPEILAEIDIIRNTRGPGVKLLGAGGGGFIYSLSSLSLNQLQKATLNYPKFSPLIDYFGTRILSTL